MKTTAMTSTETGRTVNLMLAQAFEATPPERHQRSLAQLLWLTAFGGDGAERIVRDLPDELLAQLDDPEGFFERERERRRAEAACKPG